MQPRLEDSHGNRLILMLRPFVLTLHNDARRNMGDSNSRFRPVHVLPAGAARPEGIYPEVFLFDVNLHIFRKLRVSIDRGKRGMPPVVRIKGRDADQTMDTGLTFQISIRIGAGDNERDILYACLFPGQDVDHLRLKTLFLRPHEVHSEQHFRPILRLSTACTRINIDYGVFFIGLSAEHALYLIPAEKFVEPVNSLRKLNGILWIVCLFDYVLEDGDLLKLFLFRLPGARLGLETRTLLEDRLCVFLIFPEIRLGYCVIAFFDLFSGGSEVKDNLGGFPSSVEGLLCGFLCLLSCFCYPFCYFAAKP
jgi:hypothetical protein